MIVLDLTTIDANAPHIKTIIGGIHSVFASKLRIPPDDICLERVLEWKNPKPKALELPNYFVVTIYRTNGEEISPTKYAELAVGFIELLMRANHCDLQFHFEQVLGPDPYRPFSMIEIPKSGQPTIIP